MKGRGQYWVDMQEGRLEQKEGERGEIRLEGQAGANFAEPGWPWYCLDFILRTVGSYGWLLGRRGTWSGPLFGRTPSGFSICLIL